MTVLASDRSSAGRVHSRGSWIAVVSVVLVIALVQMALPNAVTVGPDWLRWPTLELLAVPVAIFLLRRDDLLVKPAVRKLVLGYLAILVIASVSNALFLLTTLMAGSDESPATMLISGFAVLFINVLSFGLVYWWLDNGGPVARFRATQQTPDFLFPQQMIDGSTWKPTMPDYLYTAYTNVIAFSPTDTMPLTHVAKFLFTVQSAVSLVTMVVTVSRAINILT